MITPILFTVGGFLIVVGLIGYREYRERKDLEERTKTDLWMTDVIFNGIDGAIKIDDDNRKKLGY